MHEQAISHFKEQLKLLGIEKEAEITINQQFIATSSVSERVKKGFSWYPLEIKENGYGLGEHPFLLIERTKNKGNKHRFRSGNPIELFNTKGNETIQAVIHYISDDQMKLIFHIEDLPNWVSSSSLGLNFLVDEKSFLEMERAVNYLIKTENYRTTELAETILGIRTPYFLDIPHPIEIPHLNGSQNNALNDMIAAHDIGIIHGPPGTGKTTTLVQVIKQLAKGEKHILVCTPSNAAADLLTEKLAEQKLNVVRVGSISRVDEKLLPHTLDEQLKSCKEYTEIKKIKKQAAEYRKMASKFKRHFGKSEREERNQMYKQAKSLSKDANDYEDHLIDKLFNSADVITCTLVGATSRYLRDRKYHTVIIDEAAQALEAATWIPISKGQKVILAGDPFQLPPTIKSREAAKKGLGETLLERCIAKHLKVNLLDTQYRMNEQIMNFSNQQFYGGKLKADDAVRNHTIDDKAVQFIDTAGCGFEEKKDKESLSLYNQGEIELINKLLEQHILIYNNEYSIGIISPYRQQVERMTENIKKSYDFLPNVKIDTIDSFQGQERDLIIISLVRSNENAEIGFLKDYRRLNVALTRARKKLIVIGDSATLASDKFYGQFMDYIDSIDAYHSAYEFMYE